MTKAYDWKRHYSASIIKKDSNKDYDVYQIENETGIGKIVSWNVFPGVQAIFNDLYMSKCSMPVDAKSNVIELCYCIEGRYECELRKQYCFFISSGDFSVGNVGRLESRRGFPTKHFCGFTLFIEVDVFADSERRTLDELQIDLKTVNKIAQRKRWYFIIHDNEKITSIIRDIKESSTEKRLSVIKHKTPELLMFLSNLDPDENFSTPVYISKKNVLLAKKVQKMIIEDISKHITIDQISKKLNV